MFNRFIYPSGSAPGVTGVLDVTASPYNARGDGGNDDDHIFRQAIVDASVSGAPKTVYFPQGRWKIQSNLLIEHCHVVAAAGAIFTHGAADINLVNLGRCSSWSGGTFDLTASEFTGTAFLMDGARWTSSPLAGPLWAAPRLSNVDLYNYRTVSGGGVGVKLTSASGRLNEAIVSNVRMAFFQKGLHLYSSGSGYINQNRFVNLAVFQCVYGVHLEAVGTYRADANMFFGVSTQTGSLPATEYGIRIDNCRDNIFSGVMNMDGGWLYLASDTYNNIILGTGLANTIDLGTANIVSQNSTKMWNGVDMVPLAKFTWEPNSGAALTDTNDTMSGNIAFAGAAVGDFIVGAAPYDLTDCLYQARVASANVVTQQIWNESGGSRTFTSGTFNLLRIPKRKATHFASWDSPNIVAGGLQAQNFTIPGAALGDFVLCSSSANLGNLYASATVTAADTVTVVLQNFKAVAIDPASATWYFLIIPKSRANYVHTVADLASIANNSLLTINVSMPEIENGDFILGSIDVDLTDMLLGTYGYQDNAEIVLQNSTGGAVDLGAVNFRFLHFKSTDMLLL